VQSNDPSEHERGREHDADQQQMQRDHAADRSAHGLRRGIDDIDRRRLVVDDVSIQLVTGQHLARDDGVGRFVVGQARPHDRHDAQEHAQAEERERGLASHGASSMWRLMPRRFANGKHAAPRTSAMMMP